jgi:hypothetical protein
VIEASSERAGIDPAKLSDCRTAPFGESVVP